MRAFIGGALLAALLTIGCAAPPDSAELDPTPLGDDDSWHEASPCPDHVAERCLAPPDDDDLVDDDDLGDDDDLDECPPLAEGVDPRIEVEDGWQVELFAQGLGEVSGVVVGDDGGVLLGQGLGGWDSLPVVRIEQDGTVSSSSAIPDPDGVAFDDDGLAWAAGAGAIWLLHSIGPGGGDDEVWLEPGGNINDLVIDGELLYLARDGGDVLRIEADGATSVLVDLSASPAIDLGDSGDLWILARETGQLHRLDAATGAVVPEAGLAAIDPGYLTSNRVAFNPDDGTVHSASYFTGEGGQIVRWDPVTPGSMTGWITGLVDELNPDGVAWHDGCLYWTAPLSGRVYRACPCE